MDGAFALYEAWVRLQHGDIDTALVYAFGKSSPGDVGRVLALQLDPYVARPAVARRRRLAALQARAAARQRQASARRTSPASSPAAAQRASATPTPSSRATSTRRRCSTSRCSPTRCASTTCPPISDGRAVIVLAAGDRARELTEHAGVDPRHRPPHRVPGASASRDLDHVARRRASPAQKAGVDRRRRRPRRAARAVQPPGAHPHRGPRPRRDAHPHQPVAAARSRPTR